MKVLTGSGPWNAIPCDKFFGAVNLDKVAQTANVSVYGASNTYDTASIIAAANQLGIGGATATMELPDGIAVDERLISIDTDAAITGKGIAVYYGVVIH